MKELTMKELLRSKEEKRILTGRITGLEEEYYKIRNETIPCAIVWYDEIKILIPSKHLGTHKINKAIIRGMIGAEIDFIVIEIDKLSNIAIASRKEAMQLRAKIELPKLKVNDTARVRIVAVGTKYIVTDFYGKEVYILAENLRHTYIVNCRDLYSPGESLVVKIRRIDIENDKYELSAKDLIENPYKNIRKYIIETGEYRGKVIGFPKGHSGIIVQLNETMVTCLIRVPARFNLYPHYLDEVLVRITEIKEQKKLIYGYLMKVICGGKKTW